MLLSMSLVGILIFIGGLLVVLVIFIRLFIVWIMLLILGRFCYGLF